MGAWGMGIFENDDACDFAGDVAEGGGIPLIAETLDAVSLSEGDHLEAPDASKALAAAAIVARLGGNPSNNESEVIDDWVKELRPSLTPGLIDKAKQAIARVLAPESELLELWQETDDFEEWKRHLDDLSARL